MLHGHELLLHQEASSETNPLLARFPVLLLYSSVWYALLPQGATIPLPRRQCSVLHRHVRAHHIFDNGFIPLDASSLLVFTAHRQGNLCSLGSLSFPSLMISYIISSPTASSEYLFLSYFKTISREQSDWSNSLRWYSTCATTRWTRPSTSQTISIVVTF